MMNLMNMNLWSGPLFNAIKEKGHQTSLPGGPWISDRRLVVSVTF
jgi:hypothetical protein